jgi:hypothetical protein
MGELVFRQGRSDSMILEPETMGIYGLRMLSGIYESINCETVSAFQI